MAKYKRGQSGNPTGRPKGAKGRTPEEIRRLIGEFLTHNWQTVQQDFDKVTEKDRLKFREGLLKYYVSPALNLDNLSESQLEQIISYLKQQRKNEAHKK